MHLFLSSHADSMHMCYKPSSKAFIVVLKCVTAACFNLQAKATSDNFSQTRCTNTFVTFPALNSK